MSHRKVSISYTDELLVSLEESPEEFEAEARLVLAIKLYEMGRLTTGRAAELAGVGRVELMFLLGRYGLSPLGVDPEELKQDLATA